MEFEKQLDFVKSDTFKLMMIAGIETKIYYVYLL